jgi:hypothetical protein
MICRPQSDGWLLISQPAHAWIAGQLAAAWGNGDFAPPAPRETVVLATALHDIGWFEWDAAPALHPDGRPVNFLETSLDETRQVWQRGVTHVSSLDPYAGLLVSLHASTIYRRRLERGADPPAKQAELQTLLADAAAARADLQARLKGHPRYGLAVEPTVLRVNYRLLRVCDLLSLTLCTGPLEEGEITAVPGRKPDGWVAIHYLPVDDATLALAPYPFSTPQLTVEVEARRLHQRIYPNPAALQVALRDAPWTRLGYTLMAA